MALLDDELKQVHSDVVSVIQKDFHEDLMELYAVTISIAETHPEQINNEIRNALTHLGRALSAESISEADKQIRQAKSHLDRAKRDCLKLSIIVKRDQIRSAVWRIEMAEGAIPASIKTRLRKIEEERKKVFINETKGIPVEDVLESILNEALNLEESIQSQYNVPGKILTNTRIALAKIRGFLVNSAMTIVLGIVVVWLTATFGTDSIILHAKSDFESLITKVSADKTATTEVKGKS